METIIGANQIGANQKETGPLRIEGSSSADDALHKSDCSVTFFILSIACGGVIAAALTYLLLGGQISSTSLALAAVSYGAVGAAMGLLFAGFCDVILKGRLEDDELA